jgi:hypothetical protein
MSDIGLTHFLILIESIMKKVILMAAASLAIIATSFAQNATAPAPKAKMSRVKPTMEAPATQGTPAAPTTQGTPASMEKAKGHGKGQGEARGNSEGKGQGGMKALGLSPEQETQFKAVNQAHKTAVKTIQMNESLAVDAKKKQVAALVTKYQSDVQGVLNADQYAKWTAMRAKRGDKKEGGNHKEGGDKDDDDKGGDHKKGGHKADGAATTTPAEGTMTPAEAPTVKQKKSKKGH